MDAGLYIVGTPIGNLGDISQRALDTLRGANAILAEDTRMTKRLLDRFEISTPMISCHRFNEQSRAESVIQRIREGQAVALVTDSGMPGVSDPGDRVAAACREAGLTLVVIPGPSAITSAIALCGFGGVGFYFSGFLPRKSGARARELERMLAMDVPSAFYESPYRVVRILEEIHALAPDRRVFIGRELTKHFEETLVAPAAVLLERFRTRPPKGEFVFVLESAPKSKRRESEERNEGPELMTS